MADVPVQIGNYRLGKNLGIGAFGKVKRAYKPAGPLYFTRISMERPCVLRV
jgi:hypothetical protein